MINQKINFIICLPFSKDFVIMYFLSTDIDYEKLQLNLFSLYMP